MAEMRWLESHLGTIDGAVEVIEKFHWKLRIDQSEYGWSVMTGEQAIFVAKTRDEVDIFLYGMALGYVGIPSPYFEQVVEQVDRWYRDILGE